MRIEYANLAMILAFVGMIWHCALNHAPEIRPPLAVVPVLNSEGIFAFNERIKLGQADLYDLELIPRLSEVVAIRILEQRDEIIASARKLPVDTRYQALTEVRGIGKVTAQKLENYLLLE